jgi:hypothetical protein
MQELAPIVLFVYNRPWHTKKTIEALKNNELAEESDLFIFADNTVDDKNKESVDSVRKYVKTIDGFKTVNIVERETNFGLAQNVISGVTEVINRYNKVIVLEDDIVCSRIYLSYMNKLLSYYKYNEKIYSVTGYTFPIEIPVKYKYDVYFSSRASSWGWGTWKDRWEIVDWDVEDYDSFLINPEHIKSFNAGGDDLTKMLKQQMNGKIDSWSIIWSYSHFKNNSYCVYPTKSRLRNIGADRSGIHTDKTKKFDVEIYEEDTELNLTDNIILNDEIILNFQNFFSQNKFKKIISKLNNLLSR